jgi:hypothetical protein
MNCSPATRPPGSSSLVCRGQEGTTFPLPRSLIRHCCACSSPKACATVRRSPCAGRTPTSPTAFCGSVALSHGSTGTWSLVSPRRSAHALTCPSPPQLWRSWVGQGEPSGRAGQGGLDLVLDGLVFITESGTAVDPRNALRAISAAANALGISGVGLHRLRHATHMLAAGVPLHTVSELLGHASVAVTGGVYGHPPRRVCPPPSNGSQQQWAGENVCRCYTVATRQQRGRLGFCPKRPLTCCFPSG